MKTLINTIAATALIATFSAPAFASVANDVRSAAAANGNINVLVDGDTVTLTGYVEDSHSKFLAESVATKEGFDVENYLLTSD